MTFTARFTQMIDGTTEEYLALEKMEHEYLATLPDRILSALSQLKTG